MDRRRIAAIALVVAAPLLAGCPTQPGATGAAPTAAPDGANEMLANINSQRAAVGAPALGWCATLAAAAQGHSADQAGRSTMSHTGGDGSDIGTRANRSGYDGWSTLGENVAYGYRSVAAVMTGWMGSDGHRQNLLNPAFTHVGFGLAVAADGTPYWTQDFGASGRC